MFDDAFDNIAEQMRAEAAELKRLIQPHPALEQWRAEAAFLESVRTDLLQAEAMGSQMMVSTLALPDPIATDILREQAQMVAWANAQMPAGLEDRWREEMACVERARSMFPDVADRAEYFLPPPRDEIRELRDEVAELRRRLDPPDDDEPRTEVKGFRL